MTKPKLCVPDSDSDLLDRGRNWILSGMGVNAFDDYKNDKIQSVT